MAAEQALKKMAANKKTVISIRFGRI
jgi:hypothetical protein